VARHGTAKRILLAIALRCYKKREKPIWRKLQACESQQKYL